MPPQNKSQKYSYPSRFGSHSSMINAELTAQIQETNSDLVILTDEFGDYETKVSMLDTGLVDPKRYKKERLGRLFGGRNEPNK